MTTIAALRQDYLNSNLGRQDADTLPWASAQLDDFIDQGILELWPSVGEQVVADGAAPSGNLADVPSGLGTVLGQYRISRIDIVGSDDEYLDRVSSWRYHSGTKVIVKPRLDPSLTLRYTGYKPFTVSTLTTSLEAVVCYRAAALAFGAMVGQLVNSQRQQGLDSGRVVDYQTAVGASAYWQRLFVAGVQKEAHQLSYAPRAAHR